MSKGENLKYLSLEKLVSLELSTQLTPGKLRKEGCCEFKVSLRYTGSMGPE